MFIIKMGGLLTKIWCFIHKKKRNDYMQQKSNVRRNALLAYAKQLETSNNKNTMRIISGHMAEIYVKSRCEVAKITAEAIEKRQSAKK